MDELNNVVITAEERSVIQISFRTQGPNIRQQNPESASKITADPRSTVFSKSANPLNLLHKSTICELFKAKSIDLENYSAPSVSNYNQYLQSLHEIRRLDF